jgi:sensor c-di-GMP phosphodiesterase-like protein
MSAFVNPFVSGRHPRVVAFAIWIAVAAALLAAVGWFARAQLQESLTQEAKAELAHFDKLHASVTFAFAELHSTATAEPCSAEFMRELRRVAFQPDGLNEFIYAPSGMVTCSTSIAAAQTPLSLGAPDIDESEGAGFDIWIDKRLDTVGLAGVEGTVVHLDPFAIVVPAQTLSTAHSAWIKKELVLALPGGKSRPLSGDAGTFATASGVAETPAPATMLHAVACGTEHRHCVALGADVLDIAAKWQTEVILAIALIAFYAVWPASVLHRALQSYWSLEARFTRNLSKDSIVCAYQPILDLRTGEISGCEVLARWRDVDGTIVPPDRFIDIVAQSGHTLAFTRMVAERAFEELSEQLPDKTKLQINFNIFPRDLDSEKLKETFSSFETQRDRFMIALEIVESDALGIEKAQGEIEALGRHGFKTYIDDFGSGYSSIHRVASLAIHGVKLDRSFAMAPSESLMARMLVHAVDMIGSSGREIVVEGVETQDRLDLLAATGRVSYVQGYLVSRPLTIQRFSEFLADHDRSRFVGGGKMAAA